MSWWVHDLYQSLGVVALVSWIFWVLLSISLHELGHGWAAIRQGDRTPIELGRMTLNPLVHMGPLSLILFAACGIAWGLMPVNPHRFRDGRRGDVMVAAAGPLVNVLIAAACVILAAAWLAIVPQGTRAHGAGAVFLYHGIFLNVFLAVFNVLPVPPLDGARILGGISSSAARLFNHPNAPLIGLLVFILMFRSGVGDMIWGIATGAAQVVVDLAGVPFGNPSLASAMQAELAGP
jgi:Zn-dependent protease